MEFDADEVRALRERFGLLRATRGYVPPLEVLHPLMLLAGAKPELLVAEFVQKRDDESALWNIVALDQGMLTVVNGVSQQDDWYLELQMWSGHGNKLTSEVDSRTFPLSMVTAVRVLEPDQWGQPQFSDVRARWAVDHHGGTFAVPAAFSHEAEEFATAVLADLRQRDRTSS
jgi:hypothetical protein